jgi:3-hydroxyisobutyrate dehydrogenase-like beta-hydroxyacid dehydrogenase
MTQVGFVGAGRMGLPMVERLVAAGHQVQVHARRPELRAQLTTLGAQVADSSREAAEGCPLVIACLFSDAQLVAAAEGPDGLLAGLGAGAVLASHVTGTRATVAGLTQRATVVDAPVSGTADDIRAGRLAVLLGGDAAPVQLCTQVMAAYADRLLPVGRLGDALAVKLVNNLLFAAHSQLAVAAVDLGAQLGLDKNTLLTALAACSGASYATATLSRLPDAETFGRAAGPFLRKDVAACQQELDVSHGDAELLMSVVRGGRLDLTTA